jgi:hypothetical protein
MQCFIMMLQSSCNNVGTFQEGTGKQFPCLSSHAILAAPLT